MVTRQMLGSLNIHSSSFVGSMFACSNTVCSSFAVNEVNKYEMENVIFCQQRNPLLHWHLCPRNVQLNRNSAPLSMHVKRKIYFVIFTATGISKTRVKRHKSKRNKKKCPENFVRKMLAASFWKNNIPFLRMAFLNSAILLHRKS